MYGNYTKFNLATENKATAKKEFYSNILRFLKKKNTLMMKMARFSGIKQDIFPRSKRLSAHIKSISSKSRSTNRWFYKETVNPKGKPDKLIQRKNGWDVSKYGGFGSPVVAYAVAFIYEKGKARKKQKQSKESLSWSSPYLNKTQWLLSNKGYSNVTKFIKLPKYTLYELENGRRRMVASHKEAQKPIHLFYRKN